MNNKRISYGKLKEVMDLPYLLANQIESYRRFIDKGIEELFEEISPIRSGKKDDQEALALELADPHLEEPHTGKSDCRDKNLTYAYPLVVEGRLVGGGKVLKEEELFLAEIPVMTERGTFIINGSENVIVNQLTRSPGVYFTQESPGEYRAHILPEFGAWLELNLNSKRERIICSLDRKGKIPVTTLLKALGWSEKEIIKRYQFTLNPVKKEKLENYIGYKVSERIQKNSTVILEEGEEITAEVLDEVVKAKPSQVRLINKYIQNSLDKDTVESREDAIKLIYKKLRATDRAPSSRAQEYFEQLYFNSDRYYLSQVGRFMINKKLKQNESKETVLESADIIHTLDRLLKVPANENLLDDKDHLANKHIKTPGDTIRDGLRGGLKRMERITRDKLGKYSLDDSGGLRSLVSARVVQSSLNRLFYTGRMSQFMEQSNPLAELTHKRRLNALGGGLSKRRAGLDVRDVHSSHYDRICPIETPEGQNIGLITSMANYARVNDFGFLEAPYRKVEEGRVTDQIDYLMADEEQEHNIAPATIKMDDEGYIQAERVEIRTGEEELRLVAPEEVDYVEVSPKALVGVSASLIPFLEHDDSNRALMGANMQRQAMPLLKTQSPYVGTGMEERTARDSGLLVIAQREGRVKRVTANQIVIINEEGKEDKYDLVTFERSNQDTLVHQKPIVCRGDKVQKGDVLADGPACDQGELALGANLMVGFIPYEGYNYEDAIVISERLVKEDVLDSIHIQEYEIKAEETKLGPEEITSDIPGISKEELKNLDEDGIVRVGTEVGTGDILVGKITPRGESEPTPEERIFRSIFGERARNVKDSSMRLPPTPEGSKVIKVKKFTKENEPELDTGVSELVKVYVAQRKKISVGDKLSGRHGNKGVIAKILPEEEMPFLPDGTPLDILLNPLSVPSRMNLGQVLETHLGWLAQLKEVKVATPVFEGAEEEEILKELTKVRVEKGLDAGDFGDGKVTLRDGRTGQPFDHPVAVGNMYIMKLEHIADEKLHARSTGPYSLTTQQPLGGKAQFGGQRLGEMEIWALEAYGAASTLQEMLTLKSDDTRGRVQLYKAILKDEEFPRCGLPESFKVLVRELRSMGINLKAWDENDHELDIVS